MSAKNLQKYTTPFFFILGLVLLYFLIQKIGADELLSSLSNIGYRIVFILVLPIFWNLFHTLAWHQILEETGEHISIWELFKIKTSGESINTLTPVSFMGGDPVRLYLLQKRMPKTLSAASVVLDRTMLTLAVLLLVFSGLMAAWFVLDLPQTWRMSFPVFTVALALAVWWLIHRQRKGIFDTISRLLKKIGIKRHLTDNIQQKIEELDTRISRFYQEDHRRFFKVWGFHFLARLCGVVEIYLIAGFLAVDLPLSGALILASLSVLVNMLFVFIPGSMGVMEGAYGAVVILLGLDPVAGVAIQIVRRVRTISWILIGLVLMMHYSRGIPKPELSS